MFEAQINRGVEFLNENVPGWLNEIEVDRLDLSSGSFLPQDGMGCGCVLAQLYGKKKIPSTGHFMGDSFAHACRTFKLEPHNAGPFYTNTDLGDRHFSFHYGFNIDYRNRDDHFDSTAEYATLTNEWKEKIRQLRRA
jgi:hypothetical protein